MSVLLESMVINDPRIGQLKAPLSSLVFHYDTASNASQPCEIAHLGVKRPGLTTPFIYVLASPSSLKTMERVYAPLGSNIKVVPLFISMNDVTVSTILSLMKVLVL